MSWGRASVAAILTPLLLVGSAVGARAATPLPGSEQGSIGIRLLDAPADRANDPRAQIYVVDHLAPGAVIRRHIEVNSTVNSAQPVEMYVGAASIAADKFVGADGRGANELTTWMSMDHPTVALPADGKATIEVTIRVPAAASSGERYAIVWAQISSPVTSGGVMLVNRVGIRVYLDVGPGGEAASDFEIQNLVGARTLDGQPEVIAQVTNTGQRALDMRGELKLSEGPGSLSAGPFQATTGSTLAPGDTAGVSILLDRQLPAGPWTARLTLASGLVERTATATIRFPVSAGAQSAPVTPETADWHPMLLWIGGALLLGSSILLLVILSLRRRRRIGRASIVAAPRRPARHPR